MKKIVLLIPLLLLLGCGPKNITTPGTPPPPVPPVVTLLKITTQAAQADQTAAHLLDQVCYPAPPATPTLDTHTCSVVAVYLRATANAIDRVILEANGPDEWPAIKVKVPLIMVDTVTSIVVKDPKLQAAIDSLQVLLQAILGVK